jgi:hypothetical protein
LYAGDHNLRTHECKNCRVNKRANLKYIPHADRLLVLTTQRQCISNFEKDAAAEPVVKMGMKSIYLEKDVLDRVVYATEDFRSRAVGEHTHVLVIHRLRHSGTLNNERSIP